MRWNPTALHPGLDAATRLGTAVKAPAARPHRRPPGPRADGRAGGRRDRRRHPPRQGRRRHRAAPRGLIDVDAGDLEKQIAAAPKGGFVPVITLRKAAYDKIAAELQDVPGASTAPGSAPLAPSKDFARALLGAVGPATAEQVERSDGRLAPGDAVGQWGLQAHVRQAARRDRDALGRDPRRRGRRRGEDAAALARAPRRRTSRPRSTSTSSAPPSRRWATPSKKAALVALQPSTGDVLAVANRPRRLDARPRPDRPLPARLDLQGDHHDRAAARRPVDRPDRAVPAERGRRRALVQELRGRSRRARSRSAPTSPSPATRRSSRSRTACAAPRCPTRRATSASASG